jgi:phage/plasmid-like protein (TIGR03299 family)
MSHEIEGNNMFSVKLEPWHKLGKVLDHPPTSAEAIALAGMDWDVLARPLFFEDARNSHVNPVMQGILNAVVGSKVYTEIPNRKALVRSTDGQFLSVVSGDYVPLQNRDAFSFFDPFVREGLATYETAGVLRQGRRVWIQARIAGQDKTVAGEEYKPYVLLTNGHDGECAVMAMPSLQRVVCANTLRLALREGGILYFAHRGDVQRRMAEAQVLFQRTLRGLDELTAQLEALARVPIDSNGLDRYLNAVLNLPDTEVKTETEVVDDGEDNAVGARALARLQAIKGKILELHESGVTTTPGTGTLLGAYNSVAAFVDHYGGSRSKDRANWLLFGEGAQLRDKALSVAMELVQ